MTEALGTPEYMSPEQVRGGSVIDARTDIWSLGVTLYELLAGRRAFEGNSPSAIFTRIHEGSFLPLRTLRPDVSPELSAIVERCLSREPAARFATVTELAAALEGRLCATVTPERFSATMPSFAPVALERPSWSSVPPSAMSVSVGTSRESGPERRPTMFAALAGHALIAVVAAGFAFMLTGAHTRIGLDAVSGRSAHLSKSAASVVHLTAKADGATARAEAPATPTSTR